jgi:fatty acid desaturase
MAIPEQQNQGGVGSLLTSLIDDTRLLFRQEVALFKAELVQKLKTTAINSVAVVVGGILALIGMFWLLAALVFGLATIWPAWLAALVVGIGIVFLGLIFVLIGIRTLSKMSAAPERTVRTMESNIEMVKEKV